MNLYQHITLDKEAQELLDFRLPSHINRIFANHNDPEEKQFKQFSDCEIAFGNVPAEWIGKSENLKWLQLESVGYDPYNDILPEFQKRGTITNLQGFFGQPVAESVIAGILSLKRGIDELVKLKEEKEWKGAVLRPGLSLLSGAKILIAGGGNIGQNIRNILTGFNANTLIYDKNPEQTDIKTIDDFDRELRDTDVVISCLPETNDTISFFDERRFSWMQPSVIFANVGRGKVIDETALIERLNDGLIAGAVLDVTSVEPLPSEHPLWDCPNTILTQHTGGGSSRELTGKVLIFLDNLEKYISGQPLSKIVTV